MVQIATLLLAVPLGFPLDDSRRGRGIYLLVAAVLIPIQTVVVHDESGLDWSYWVINALTLAVGVGLHAFGVRLRARRREGSALRTAGDAR